MGKMKAMHSFPHMSDGDDGGRGEGLSTQHEQHLKLPLRRHARKQRRVMVDLDIPYFYATIDGTHVAFITTAGFDRIK